MYRFTCTININCKKKLKIKNPGPFPTWVVCKLRPGPLKRSKWSNPRTRSHWKDNPAQWGPTKLSPCDLRLYVEKTESVSQYLSSSPPVHANAKRRRLVRSLWKVSHTQKRTGDFFISMLTYLRFERHWPPFRFQKLIWDLREKEEKPKSFQFLMDQFATATFACMKHYCQVPIPIYHCFQRAMGDYYMAVSLFSFGLTHCLLYSST